MVHTGFANKEGRVMSQRAPSEEPGRESPSDCKAKRSNTEAKAKVGKEKKPDPQTRNLPCCKFSLRREKLVVRVHPAT